MTIVTRSFGYQNLGEAIPTPAITSCDMFGFSECQRKDLTGIKRHHKYLPARDPKQALFSDKNKFEHVRNGYITFHKSGESEGFSVKTPPRGIAYEVWRIGDVEGVFAITHWLNSWMPLPAGRDRFTNDRRKIVERTTIPKTRKFIETQLNKDRIVILTGDINSIPWSGDIHPEMRQVRDRGIDRLWISKDKRVKGTELDLTAKTGSGGQLEHHGLKLTARFDV